MELKPKEALNNPEFFQTGLVFKEISRPWKNEDGVTIGTKVLLSNSILNEFGKSVTREIIVKISKDIEYFNSLEEGDFVSLQGLELGVWNNKGFITLSAKANDLKIKI